MLLKVFAELVKNVQLYIGGVDMCISVHFTRCFEGQVHQIPHLCTRELRRRSGIFLGVDRVLYNIWVGRLYARGIFREMWIVCFARILRNNKNSDEDLYADPKTDSSLLKRDLTWHLQSLGWHSIACVSVFNGDASCLASTASLVL